MFFRNHTELVNANENKEYAKYLSNLDLFYTNQGSVDVKTGKYVLVLFCGNELRRIDFFVRRRKANRLFVSCSA